MNLQKQKPTRDKKYLDFIRTQRCCVGVHCGVDDLEDTEDYETQYHHTETGGMGMKGSDLETIPLCPRHHRHAHSMGRVTFYIHYGLDRYEIMFNSLRRYLECLGSTK